jgi:hypothetical protein
MTTHITEGVLMTDQTTQPAEHTVSDMPAPPETTADQMIVESLTYAQAHWKAIFGNDNNDATSRQLHIDSALTGFSEAFLLDRLQTATSTEIADATALALHEILMDGGGAGEWIWDLLADRGVDPATIQPAPDPRADLVAENAKLTAEVKRLTDRANVDETALEEVLGERDQYSDVADELAAAIAVITGVDVGEHSSANDPWYEALEAAKAFPAKLAAALSASGPWMAVLADSAGFCIDDLDELLEGEDGGTISIVRDSALPEARHDDGDLRLPGSFATLDQFMEWDLGDFDSDDDARQTWARAQAAAAGMNAAVKA